MKAKFAPQSSCPEDGRALPANLLSISDHLMLFSRIRMGCSLQAVTGSVSLVEIATACVSSGEEHKRGV